MSAIETLKSIVGQDQEPGEWLEMTQDRINQFADATGDHQWIHVDVEKAKAGPFGKPIAHGYLTLSLIPYLAGALTLPINVKMGINYGLNRVRFITPVPVGSRVRARRKVLEVSEIPNNGAQIVTEVTIEIDGADKPACVAETVSRVYF